MLKNLSLAVLAWLCGLTSLPADPQPLTRVHAHNDYEHTHPLFDALAHGFCSVEADIHLVDGKLLIAHDRSQVKPERTLEALYLKPLLERVKKNHGHVYLGGPEFTLLIDVKGSWQSTYPLLRDVLKDYSEILTSFRDGRKETNAIVAIITGDRSREMFRGEAVRYAAMDGELTDLNSNDSPELIPWISSDWSRNFKWRGSGTISPPEKLKVQQIVSRAHQQGRLVRFWGAPDQPVFWREMLADGVDLINTDDLEGARKFFESADNNH